jgi:DNA-binding transcriptional MerR regulator
MLRIGEFARLCRVSVRTLRFYEERGLLRPAKIDEATGYRYYRVDQLARVSRILALRDLGLSLDQIAALLATGRLSTQSFRTMLDAKRAELEAHVRTEQARLRRVEARLLQIEEGRMPNYEIVVKSVEPLRVASRRRVIESMDQLTTVLPYMFGEVYQYLGERGIQPAGPAMEVWYNTHEFTGRDMDVETCVPIAVEIPGSGTITVHTLDAVPAMATTIYQGPYSGLGEAYEALAHWVQTNSHKIVGYDRSIVHAHHRDGDPNDNRVEVQFPVERLTA